MGIALSMKYNAVYTILNDKTALTNTVFFMMFHLQCHETKVKASVMKMKCENILNLGRIQNVISEIP